MIHSLSKLGTFEQCAAKYKFKYIEKLPAPSGPQANRGIETHSTIEHFLLGTIDKLPEELSFYEGFLRGLRTFKGMVPEARLAFNKNWEPREWEDEDLYWRGVLDLLVPPQEGTAYVYDWKTGKIYDDHAAQREIYALATFLKFPDALQVHTESVYLDLNARRSSRFSRGELEGLRPKWDRRFQTLDAATEFPYNPQYSCRWCPFSKASGGPCPF